MRLLFWSCVGFAIFFVYAIYLNFFQLTVSKAALEPKRPVGFYDYRTITHAHSILSTGSGTPTEIIEAAKEAQVDILFLTEVNPRQHYSELESYYGRVFVLTGGEYSYVDSRLMYYGRPPNQPPDKMGQAQVYFTDLLSQKDRPADTGFVVLAHPQLYGYSWSGQYPPGLDGIEVLNLRRFVEAAWSSSKLSVLHALLTYPLNPQLALLFLYENPNDELSLWDQLSRTRKTVGFVGTDATSKAILYGDTYFKTPPYELLFSVASNHLLLRSELTGNTQTDRLKVLEALQKGEFYMSLDILADPKGFWTEIKSDGKTYSLGSRIKLGHSTQLTVHLPEGLEVPFEIVIYKDGEHYVTSNSIETNLQLQSKGVYRMVVRVLPQFPFPLGKRWVPWIFTNAFRVE